MTQTEVDIISKTIHGSRLYGTNFPESDHDYKGVFIPSAREIVRQKIVDTKNFSTGDKHSKNSADDTDEEYFAVHKFMHMLYLGDMVATEMLFAPYDNPTPEWELILSHRHRLVSRKMTGFVGYAQRQANVYGAKGVRLNEIQAAIQFLKENFPIADKISTVPNAIQLIEDFCKDKVHTKVTWIESKGVMVFHFECCDRKIPLTVQTKEAIKIFQRVEDEYGNRARAAQTGEGIEWKSMSHAVRISFAALDLIRTGKLEFPTPDAEFLKLIRLGQVDPKEVEIILDDNLTAIEQLSTTCSILPEVADQELMTQITEELYLGKVYKYMRGTPDEYHS